MRMSIRTKSAAFVLALLVAVTLPGGSANGQTTAPSGPPIAQMPDNWQQLSLTNLSPVIQAYYKANGHLLIAQTQRAQVAQYVWNQYLIDDQHFQQAWATDQDSLTWIVSYVARDLPSASDSALATRFTAIANNSAAIAPLRYRYVKHLCLALTSLNVAPSVGQQMVTAWIASWTQQQSVAASNIGNMGQAILNDTANGSSAARQAITAMAWNNYLSSASYVSTGKFTDLVRLLDIFGSQLSDAQRQQLLPEVLQRFQADTADLSAVSFPHLAPTIVLALRHVGASDPQIAGVIAAWAQLRDQRATYTDDDGGPDRQIMCFYALAAGGATSQSFYQAIATALQNNGAPIGPTTVTLTGYSNMILGNLATWGAQLDTQLSSSSLSGDADAIVLLAKSDAVELSNGCPGNLAGQQWAEQAMATAQTPNLRVACARWLMSRMLMARNFTQASSYVTALSSQLTDASSTQQLNQLALHIAESTAREQQETTVMANVVAAQQPSARLAGQLALLQTQLAKAQATSRPSSEIQNLQSLIANVQAQISQATTAPSQ
jgi:hypothetical protein